MTQKKQKPKIHENQIHIKDYKVISHSSKINEKPSLEIEVEHGFLSHGFYNNNGNFKPSLISPHPIKDIATIFASNNHYCFVDTNEISKSSHLSNRFTHITAIYIFTVNRFSKKKDIYKVDTNFKDSIIGFYVFNAPKDSKPEIIGWSDAIRRLNELNPIHSHIFVDSDQAEMFNLNKMLGKKFSFYYVSGDRQPTIYNTIFRRLDKISHLAYKYKGYVFCKYRTIDFLWGNINHLDKKEYMLKDDMFLNY